MTVTIYPDNTADVDGTLCGTNEDYGIPKVRLAPMGKTMEDVMIERRGNVLIKAFYTGADRTDEDRREYDRQYRQMAKARIERAYKDHQLRKINKGLAMIEMARRG